MDTNSYAPRSATRLLILGIDQPGHVCHFLMVAARQLGIDVQVMDARQADARSRLVNNSLFARLTDRRPARLGYFGARVAEKCALFRPHVVLTTGRAALDSSHIKALKDLGAKVINYSTDDPWNPVMRSQWFISTLPFYNAVFSPRHENFDDFRRCGVQNLHYLPFAYDKEVHRPWPISEAPGEASDVLFVGGADADRRPLISALIGAGLDLALFGGYWNRYAETRGHWRGLADQVTIRAASASAKVCLCLVRRANRDGHTMRSFEAAAIGGCILAEDTADHREIFGPEDYAARYFKSESDMVLQAKALVAHVQTRRRLSENLHERLTARSDTYTDRLVAMLQLTSMDASPMAALKSTN